MLESRANDPERKDRKSIFQKKPLKKCHITDIKIKSTLVHVFMNKNISYKNTKLKVVQIIQHDLKNIKPTFWFK